MTQWCVEQLTTGSARGIFHSHSYYDLNVFDASSRFIVAHRIHGVSERPLQADDRIGIGLVDTEAGGRWLPLGESRAWSWQQGPMAQWLPCGTRMLWNDREDGRFVTRVCNIRGEVEAVLPIASYAVDPRGGFTLGLNMARLDTLRPGYGYRGGRGALLESRYPGNDGIWRQSLEGDEPQLILSLDRAVSFLRARSGWRDGFRRRIRRCHYWFNHVKISPDGRRFTVKLRFRSRHPLRGWGNRAGVSLTCGTDGRDLRLLTDSTSHVIWRDGTSLHLWRRPDGLCLYEDTAPRGRYIRAIAPDLIRHDVHARYLPGSSKRLVFDTPYREDVALLLHDEETNVTQRLARFGNHRPAQGPYRCDLHPCPSPDGRKIVVTSLEDGGRQVHLLRLVANS